MVNTTARGKIRTVVLSHRSRMRSLTTTMRLVRAMWTGFTSCTRLASRISRITANFVSRRVLHQRKTVARSDYNCNHSDFLGGMLCLFGDIHRRHGGVLARCTVSQKKINYPKVSWFPQRLKIFNWEFLKQILQAKYNITRLKLEIIKYFFLILRRYEHTFSRWGNQETLG